MWCRPARGASGTCETRSACHPADRRNPECPRTRRKVSLLADRRGETSIQSGLCTTLRRQGGSRPLEQEHLQRPSLDPLVRRQGVPNDRSLVHTRGHRASMSRRRQLCPDRMQYAGPCFGQLQVDGPQPQWTLVDGHRPSLSSLSPELQSPDRVSLQWSRRLALQSACALHACSRPQMVLSHPSPFFPPRPVPSFLL